MRILVVEDEAALRESLKSELSAAGHAVDVAADGEEGLFAALEYPIDVAIIDLGLPGLPGLEVIRKLGYRKTCPIALNLPACEDWTEPADAPAFSKPLPVEDVGESHEGA